MLGLFDQVLLVVLGSQLPQFVRTLLKAALADNEIVEHPGQHSAVLIVSQQGVTAEVFSVLWL